MWWPWAIVQGLSLILRSDHPDIFRIVKYDELVPLLKGSIAKHKTILGSNHPHALKSMRFPTCSYETRWIWCGRGSSQAIFCKVDPNPSSPLIYNLFTPKIDKMKSFRIALLLSFSPSYVLALKCGIKGVTKTCIGDICKVNCCSLCRTYFCRAWKDVQVYRYRFKWSNW